MILNLKRDATQLLVLNKRATIGLIATLAKCKLSIKLFNLLNENVVLNCTLIPQGITSCSRSVIKKLYKEVQSYQFHTNNINVMPRAWIATTKVLKKYFSVTYNSIYRHGGVVYDSVYRHCGDVYNSVFRHGAVVYNSGFRPGGLVCNSVNRHGGVV